MVGRVMGLCGLGASLALLVLAGCAADSSGGGSVAWGSGSSSGGGTGTPAAQPVVAVVDTNQTMTASPGQGVGVFVQYQAGGHWNIWWTCDTDKTGLTCSFDVTVSVSTGTIANLAGEGLESGDSVRPVDQSGAQTVQALTTTSTGVDGMTFDTPLGSSAPVITVSASVGGAQSGSFFFFVQDGRINGGYTGTLPDPLSFEPSSP